MLKPHRKPSPGRKKSCDRVKRKKKKNKVKGQKGKIHYSGGRKEGSTSPFSYYREGLGGDLMGRKRGPLKTSDAPLQDLPKPSSKALPKRGRDLVVFITEPDPALLDRRKTPPKGGKATALAHRQFRGEKLTGTRESWSPTSSQERSLRPREPSRGIPETVPSSGMYPWPAKRRGGNRKGGIRIP